MTSKLESLQKQVEAAKKRLDDRLDCICSVGGKSNIIDFHSIKANKGMSPLGIMLESLEKKGDEGNITQELAPKQNDTLSPVQKAVIIHLFDR